MQVAFTLCHSTPHPEPIETGGLLPQHCPTHAWHLYAEHPDPAIAAKAADHIGEFVFASSDRLLAMAYAFKIRSDGLARMRGTTVLHGLLDEPVAMAIVGEAEAYIEALSRSKPTLFTITETADFQRVIGPDGYRSSEWVSRKPVPASALVAERVSLADMEGKIEFFEIAPEIRHEPVVRDILGRMPKLQLVREGLIRPINHKLGLPPVFSHDFGVSPRSSRPNALES